MKPLLLVDVDGVLNRLNGEASPADGINFMYTVPKGEFQSGNTFRIRLLERYGAWLNELAEHFELVWATTWQDSANTVIGPRLGLPELPVIYVLQSGGWGSFDRGVGTWKLPAVEAYVGDRPCAWIDDDLGGDAHTWAQERTAAGIPTLLVCPSPSAGLARRHVIELEKFAQQVEGGS